MGCRWIEAILAVLIIVFTWWPTQISKWIVIVSAALLLIHALFCKNCEGLCMGMMKPRRSGGKRRR